MYSVFTNCRSFNQNLNSWDFSKVTTMYQGFANSPVNPTYAFNNGGVAINWNPTSCTDFDLIFYSNKSLSVAIHFNLSTDVGKSISLAGFVWNNPTYNAAVTFNSTIRVTDMSRLFASCSAFNQPVAFDTTSATTLYSMFFDCTDFNQDLSGWNVSNVSNFTNFLLGCTLSTANYTALLVAWELLDLVNNLAFHGGTSKYTATGQTAKNAIIAADNWTFTDGGLL